MEQQKLLFQQMRLTQRDLQPIKEKLSKLQNKNVAENLVNKVACHMQQHISEGNISIPTNQTAFHKDKKAQKPVIVESEVKLKEITEKKDQIQKQLDALRKQEQNLKLTKTSNSKLNHSHQYYRSELTAEDIAKIKKLKQEQKNFEKMLSEKTEQYVQRMKRIKEQEEQEKQRQKRQKYELKKQQIEKTIQLIEKRKQQRESRRDEQNKMMKELKNRKKLHEQWQQKWKTTQEEEERKKQELKQELRKMKKVTHEEIKQHQKRYNEVMKTQKQSRMKQVATSRLNSFFYQSVFLQQIMEEDEKKKQDIEVKNSMPKQCLNKRKEYSEKVKVLHRPTVKPKVQQEKPQQSKKQAEIRSMSLFQTHQKGNEYMRSANLQVSQAFKRRDVNTSTELKKSQKQPRYKNYLKQLKTNQTSPHPKSQLSTIRGILNKQNLSAEQKFYKAKILTQKLENRKVIHTSQGIVDSINVKLQILKNVQF